MANKNKGLINKLIGWSYIKDSLVQTKKMLTAEKKENYIIETFDEALVRQNLTTDEDIYSTLKKNYQGRKTSSLVTLFFSGLVFLNLTRLIYSNEISGAFISIDKGTIGILTIIIYSLASLALFLMSSLDSFRCFQISRRELGGIKEFYKNPINFFPKRFSKIEWLDEINKRIEDKEGA